MVMIGCHSTHSIGVRQFCKVHLIYQLPHEVDGYGGPGRDSGAKSTKVHDFPFSSSALHFGQHTQEVGRDAVQGCASAKYKFEIQLVKA